MDDIFNTLEKELLKALNTPNSTPLTEKNLKISQDFHNKYYDKMFDKKVKVTLKDKTEIIGLYNDEFYEECSVFVDYKVVKIADIVSMELAE